MNSLLILEAEAVVHFYETAFTAGGPQIASARSHLKVPA
jgi:hypothetical protein